MQKIIECNLQKGIPGELLQEERFHRVMLVRDASYPFLPFGKVVESLPQIVQTFSDFSSNPSYESVCQGVDLFRDAGCDGIIAVGGGSAIDVAKCIKLFSTRTGDKSDLEQEAKGNSILLVAVPTTAGTGSESTRYAVIYKGDQKQSITHESIVPDYALLDASALHTLPLYQKKCTMLDAICQSIESFWSVHSTDASRRLSQEALRMLMKNRKLYLAGDAHTAQSVMLAANLAGQAINITQTTAAHAMSYRLTKMFRLPHGHAVAVCLPGVWRYTWRHTAQTIDPRGEAYLRETLKQIAQTMGCPDTEEAISLFEHMLREMEIMPPAPDKAQLEALAGSVNVDRLKNAPVPLTKDVLFDLYSHLEGEA